jgi:hypothetical protein
MNVIFYAIRIKGTDFYKASSHLEFSTYEVALQNGVFYNQKKSAEKVIKESMKRINGTNGYYVTRFEICDPETEQVKYFSANQEYVEAEDYPIEFMAIELEIVELKMVLA